MGAQDYREQFMQKCYRPALKELTEQTQETLYQKGEEMIETLLSPIAGYLSAVRERQDKGQAGPVSWVSLSFSRASLLQGSPVLVAEAYRNAPFLDKPELTGLINAGWIFPCYEAFREDMRERAEQELLSRYIRRPEQKAYESMAVSALLRLVFLCLKNAAWGLEEEPAWKEWEKEGNFTLSFGEYMDWQMPLAAVRPGTDLFLDAGEESLTYRRFRDIHYEDKAFPDWTLDNCVFERCTFRNSTFTGTRLRNARFLECVLEGCRLEGVQMMGSSILNSRLKDVVFSRCGLSEGWQHEGGSMYYTPTRIRWSLLEKVRYASMEVPEGLYDGCQLFDVIQEEETG